MAETKQIACLANSRKKSGRCIAGKEVLQNGYGGWIRPVSARPSAEISNNESRYGKGGAPKLLDMIAIPICRPVPRFHQTENHLIDNGSWIKSCALSWADLKYMVDSPAPLWTNGESTRHGRNDRVKAEIAACLKSSLILIKPEKLKLEVVTEGLEFPPARRRVRAEFDYLGTSYNLVVTDLAAETTLLARPNEAYERKNTYLSISLSEAHTDGWCYKLVAAVLGKERL